MDDVGYKSFPKRVLRKIVWIIKHRPGRWPPWPGSVRFGSFRRVTPISTCFGFDRGRPVDRYYIESFLERHAKDIRGRVLELEDNAYTKRFGGERVTRSDVLNVDEGNPNSTIVADLMTAHHLPGEAFDCIIFTHALEYMYDPHAALFTLHRILKPSGVILATVPGISSIYNPSLKHYWSFTQWSAERLFKECFAGSAVEVESHGNVLASIGFLEGLSYTELKRDELDYRDPDYPVVVAVRAQKRQ